ncbi:MAG: DUF4922 domain-containing protein [Bacteroidales bacterium]|nr:DUF4922 domain-containing protein [Bacteroidales bacterium]
MYSEKINELFSQQLNDWELARINYRGLSKVRTKKLSFGLYEVYVQFNPARIISSSAKVDVRSIEERPCFLCSGNRPKEQTGIPIEDDMIILVNPFPIFRRHLTIPSELHTAQRILKNFSQMLFLSQAMHLYTVFYNGPQSGASAPDHMHFQAGNIGFMPIEMDFTEGRHARLISSESGLEIWKWEGYLRGIITLRGNNGEKLAGVFGKLFESLDRRQPERPEPMLNILSGYSSDEWTIHIFPRKQHRPRQYFLSGGDKLLVSPAAVDLGGVIITPREEDYEKITGEDVIDIFTQVCFSDTEIEEIVSEII